MKKIIILIRSPFFLSLIPFIIIVLLVPFRFNKYILETESSLILPKNHYVLYEDLDNDGSSEKILAFSENNTTGISISTEDGIIDQWNFKGNFDFGSKKCLFITGDKDNDGDKEIYVFTLNKDTILMHCISNLRDPLLSIKNRLIAVAGLGLKNPDPFIIPAEMEDLDGDGIKELIFGIGSGFSHYPRNVFAYYISKDSLVVSPESFYFITSILQADINGDGKREILPYGYAAGNVRPEKATYHDCSSFLMVLDQNLKFLFKPLEFKGEYNGLTPAIWKTSGEKSVVWLFNSSSEKKPSTFYSVNPEGIITDSVPLKYYALRCINTEGRNIENMMFLVALKKGLGLINNKFELIKVLSHESPYNLVQADVDLDGKKEILLPDLGKGKLFIYRTELTEPVSVSIHLSGNWDDFITVKINKESAPVLSVQSGEIENLLNYRINPAYPYYYLYYPGIYFGILLFALTIKSVQKNQLKRKYENEKKISELQLALIRSQLDPHFTLNAINSIIYSIEYADREEAGNRLRQFANLYRSLLMSANSSRWSLEEELEFCNDYLMLEKMRFGEKFDFKISNSENVNTEILVPKVLIQIHAENAIKHGLSTLETGGLLDIDLKMIEEELVIEITDNGIGREKARNQNKSSTGKGLETMEELYSIYNKYYGEEIRSEIIDLYDLNSNPAGTRVKIRIMQNERG